MHTAREADTAAKAETAAAADTAATAAAADTAARRGHARASPRRRARISPPRARDLRLSAMLSTRCAPLSTEGSSDSLELSSEAPTPEGGECLQESPMDGLISTHGRTWDPRHCAPMGGPDCQGLYSHIIGVDKVPHRFLAVPVCCVAIEVDLARSPKTEERCAATTIAPVTSSPLPFSPLACGRHSHPRPVSTHARPPRVPCGAQTSMGARSKLSGTVATWWFAIREAHSLTHPPAL